MKKYNPLIILLAITFAGFSQATADSRTDAGLILLGVPSARPAALGQAFSAAPDDAAAFHYNPAALGTLHRGHISFLYQKGFFDDFTSHILVARPSRNGGMGLSVGYYNGGEILLSDGISETRVIAQRDLAINLGAARHAGPFSFGMTAKFISSELAETDHANAYATDVGLGLRVSRRLQTGVAVQNIGSRLKFNNEAERLPRILRAGAHYLLIPSGFKTRILAEAPYYMNEKEIRPAVGVETLLGPLAFRLGYKKETSAEEFSIGTGFGLGETSFDYSIGMVNDLNSIQRFSLGHRFGGDVTRQTPFVPATEKSPSPSDSWYEWDESSPIIFPESPEPEDKKEEVAP